jgi:hypothetical protein
MPSYGTETVVIVDEETPILLAEAQFEEAFKLDGPPACQDFFFALLFYAHFLLMIWLVVAIAPQGFDKIDLNYTIIEDVIRKSDDITEEQFLQFQGFVSQLTSFLQVYPLRIFLFLIVPCSLLAFLTTWFVAIVLYRRFPKLLLYCCLLKPLLLVAAGAIAIASLSGSVLGWFFPVIAIIVMFYYTAIAWRYVPYAAVNIKVALTGIFPNWGVLILAGGFAKLGIIWFIYWLYVIIGVFSYKDNQCREAHPERNFDITSPDFDNSCHPPIMVVLLFLLSLYWTSVVTTVCV